MKDDHVVQIKSELKGLFDPACFALVVSWLAFVHGP